MSIVLSMSLVTAVLLEDGTWHDVTPGSIGLDREPQFIDPTDGTSIAGPNGPWVGFASSDGNQYGAPLSQVVGVRYTRPPVAGGAGLTGSGGITATP